MGYVISTINVLFSVYYFIMVLRAILPWIPHNREHALIKPIYRLTDPVLAPIRMGLPPPKVGMDVSPFIAIILLWLVQQIIVHSLGG
ncbi:MAG: YggT family protein [Candidatus Margulisiibacteriota bacterium]